MQCVQSAPIAAVPTRPNIKPPFLNALGMARMPDPRLLLIKCNKAPLSLNQKKTHTLNNTTCVNPILKTNSKNIRLSYDRRTARRRRVGAVENPPLPKILRDNRDPRPVDRVPAFGNRTTTVSGPPFTTRTARTTFRPVPPFSRAARRSDRVRNRWRL